MSQPQPFHSYSFDVWTDQPGQASLPMVVTRYGLTHEDTLAAVRADLKPGILVTPRTHNRARCCPPHIAVRGSTRDEYASPAPELTAYLRECYPQLAEATSRRYGDPGTPADYIQHHGWGHPGPSDPLRCSTCAGQA